MPDYRFSRHARNRLRFFGLSRENAVAIIEHPDVSTLDDLGHSVAWRYMGPNWTRRTDEEWVKIVYNPQDAAIITISASDGPQEGGTP